jgi:hypothetical protein
MQATMNDSIIDEMPSSEQAAAQPVSGQTSNLQSNERTLIYHLLSTGSGVETTAEDCHDLIEEAREMKDHAQPIEFEDLFDGMIIGLFSGLHVTDCQAKLINDIVLHEVDILPAKEISSSTGEDTDAFTVAMVSTSHEQSAVNAACPRGVNFSSLQQLFAKTQLSSSKSQMIIAAMQ